MHIEVNHVNSVQQVGPEENKQPEKHKVKIYREKKIKNYFKKLYGTVRVARVGDFSIYPLLETYKRERER